MKRICRKIRFMANVFILIVALPALTFAETNFSQIISFGASLSDPGNAFALTGWQSTPPYDNLDVFLIPNAPYAKGGHHFSNGDTWIEQFARKVGLAGDANPAFLGAGTNYAVGGARAHDAEGRINLSDQVSMFLEDFDWIAPSDALYTLEFGGNDIRDVLAANAAGDEELGDLIFGNALISISEHILRLYDHGARKFLIWNVPDVGLTPALAIMDSLFPEVEAKEAAQYVSWLFNNFLESYLYGLSMLDGIEIISFDAYGIMHGLVYDGDAFGLVDTESACVQPQMPPFQCKKPDEYLFWDGIHPTKAVHSILAQHAIELLMGP